MPWQLCFSKTSLVINITVYNITVYVAALGLWVVEKWKHFQFSRLFYYVLLPNRSQNFFHQRPTQQIYSAKQNLFDQELLLVPQGEEFIGWMFREKRIRRTRDLIEYRISWCVLARFLPIWSKSTIFYFQKLIVTIILGRDSCIEIPQPEIAETFKRPWYFSKFKQKFSALKLAGFHLSTSRSTTVVNWQ